MTDSFFNEGIADKTQIGFEYQDFVAIEYLMDMKPGESVGIEVLDDVHHERLSGVTSLVQVKHSVSDDSRLRNRDLDLWKTLSNWADAFVQLKDKQIKFIFFTNKRPTSSEGFLQLLIADSIDFEKIEVTLVQLGSDLNLAESNKRPGAKTNPIKRYVDNVIAMNKEERQQLFRNVQFVFDESSILTRLKSKLELLAIGSAHTQNVLDQIIGTFKRKKYELIKTGQKLEIDFESFRKEFEFDRTISIARDRVIDFSRYKQFKNVNSIDPKKGVFSLQLFDIDIEQEEILDFALQYAYTSMFMQNLISEGNFTETENEAFEEEIIQGWKNKYRQNYNQHINSELHHKTIARDCLYHTIDQPVTVSNTNVSKPIVEGKSIELSDKCHIGWRKDWKSRYNISS